MKLRHVTLPDGTAAVVNVEALQLLVENGLGSILGFSTGAQLQVRESIASVLGSDYPPPQVMIQ